MWNSSLWVRNRKHHLFVSCSTSRCPSCLTRLLHYSDYAWLPARESAWLRCQGGNQRKKLTHLRWETGNSVFPALLLLSEKIKSKLGLKEWRPRWDFTHLSRMCRSVSFPSFDLLSLSLRLNLFWLVYSLLSPSSFHTLPHLCPLVLFALLLKEFLHPLNLQPNFSSLSLSSTNCRTSTQ